MKHFDWSILTLNYKIQCTILSWATGEKNNVCSLIFDQLIKTSQGLQDGYVIPDFISMLLFAANSWIFWMIVRVCLI